MNLEIFSDLDIQGENWLWQNENKQVKCKKKNISVISRGEVELMCEGCFSLTTESDSE